MRKAILTSACMLLGIAGLHAQFYLRGEVRDDKGQPLQNVRIVLASNGLTFSTGTAGDYGFNAPLRADTLLMTLEGYESVSVPVLSGRYEQVRMRLSSFSANLQRHSLLSMSRNANRYPVRFRLMGDESYNALIENEFREVRREPEMSLVLNVNRASYSNVRRFLRMDSEVPRDAVRIEEMLNYFPLNAAPLRGDSLFRISGRLTDCPWNPASRLFFVTVTARRLDLAKVPPGNLVFLIDASGSMELPNRLPLLKVAFRKLVENLRITDTVSIVTYGDAPGIRLPPTGGAEKRRIMDVIDSLDAAGTTPGEAGIMTAYRLARSRFVKGGNNRVILATDGDFNVGRIKEQELEELITRERQGGIYLTCLGVGMGNYKDSKIEVLARKGNGNFAYLDDEREAEKVLVQELTQTLYAVADDVYMTVRFNPSFTAGYRLIGFDNKVAALQDTTMVLEGGEIGSGHSVMAVFELTPSSTGTPPPVQTAGELAAVQLHYRNPGEEVDREIRRGIPFSYARQEELPQQYRFASAVALFGSMLRESKHAAGMTWENMVLTAGRSIDPVDPLQVQFLELVQRAARLYGQKRRRRGGE